MKENELSYYTEYKELSDDEIIDTYKTLLIKTTKEPESTDFIENVTRLNTVIRIKQERKIDIVKRFEPDPNIRKEAFRKLRNFGLKGVLYLLIGSILFIVSLNIYLENNRLFYGLLLIGGLLIIVGFSIIAFYFYMYYRHKKSK